MVNSEVSILEHLALGATFILGPDLVLGEDINELSR